MATQGENREGQVLRCNNVTRSRKDNRYLTMFFASRPDGDLNVAVRN
jgi:hypothetical protein